MNLRVLKCFKKKQINQTKNIFFLDYFFENGIFQIHDVELT